MCKSSQQRWHLSWTLKGSDGQRWREDIPGKRNHVSQGQEVRRCRAHSVKGGMGVCDSLRLVGWDRNPKSLESHAGKFTLDSTGNVEPSDVFAHGCNMFPLGRLDVCFTAAVLSQNIYGVPPKCRSVQCWGRWIEIGVIEEEISCGVL